MELFDVTVDILGKKTDVHYKSGTLYTNSPKYFMKYYLCNEVEECGICLSGTAISKFSSTSQIDEQTNIMVEKAEDRLITFPTAKESVDKYKTALKVVYMEEVSRNLATKQILTWIKKDIINVDKNNIAIFGLLWLLSDKSLSYSAWLAVICLLTNINYCEAYRNFRASFITSDKRKLLEDEVMAMGLGEIVSEPVRKDDLKLYMKIKDGNFRFK